MIAGMLLAVLTVGSPFADGCVLQRDRPIPIWGTADVGTAVTVEFAGQRKLAKADADGDWRIDLDPLPASKESRTLVVTNERSSEQLRITDILVGEVWLASGQSNMAFAFYDDNPRNRERNAGLVAQLTRCPYLRLAKIGARQAAEPAKQVAMSWFAAEPRQLLSPQHPISAVGFHFAKTLQENLGVPVGLIDASVGASAIDSWIPAPEYAGMHPPAPGAKRYPPNVYFNGMVAPLAPFACRGFIWYQGESNTKSGEVEKYPEKLRALRGGWARVFENPKLTIRLSQTAPCWSPLVPDMQCAMARYAETEPLAAVGIIADIGNLFDIHPNDKETVGRRLAALALKYDYALDIRADSPSVRGGRLAADGTVHLPVKDAEKLYLYHPDWMYRLDTNRTDELGFELAGADGIWKPARILNLVRTVTGRDPQTAEPTSEFRGQLEGREIVLTADGVPSPVRARHLFRKPWRASVYNEVSLPLGAFEVSVTSSGIAPFPKTGIVDLPAGEVRVSMSTAAWHSLYISNHDHLDSRPVAFPVVGATNLTIRGHGTRLRLDAPGIAFLFRDCQGVTLEDVAIDWETPACREAVIEELSPTGTRFKFNDPLLKQGRSLIRIFRGDTREMLPGTGEVYLPQDAELAASGDWWLPHDFSQDGAGAKVGDVLAFRPFLRQYPAIVADRAADTVLRRVSVHTAWGMALLAQKCDNFTWDGGGVWPSGRRYASTNADATHFSNVKGVVRIENCRFEAMMDDAINVHSTCLAIRERLSPTKIRCRYMHDQAIGFELFAPGDRLRFIKADTLDCGAETTVRAVCRETPREVVLTLATPLPDEFGVGDAVENADFQCAVVFRSNRVLRNRARGALFTTPHPVRIESNVFERVTGAALLFSGDAGSWYESGSCRDVLIRGNIFRDCMFAVAERNLSRAVISFNPVVKSLDREKARYHSGVRIVDNVFDMFPAPLLYVSCVSNLTFSGNTLRRNADYPPRRDTRPFIVEHSESIALPETIP